jgi:hypothetical protein
VPFAFPAILGTTNEPSDPSDAYTVSERWIVSSFTIWAILLGFIVRILSLALGFADAQKIAFGAIGRIIKQDELSSGIPHGRCIRG